MSVAKIEMASNKVFPFKMHQEQNFVFKSGNVDNSYLWHLRYDHLNIRGLKLLKENHMLVGLPHINSQSKVCEG